MLKKLFTFNWFWLIIEPVKKVIKIATLNAITRLRKKEGIQSISHFLNLTATVFEVIPVCEELKWLNPKNYSLTQRGLPTC